MVVALRPFQREFMAAVESPEYDTVALCGPRGLGKTFIAAHVLTRCLTPGDSLHQPGKEYILGASSLDQARMTYAFIRAALEPTGEYRWIDSTTRLGATHIASNTKLRAISSNAKSSFGLVNVGVAVIDEPGALEIVGGQMLADSLFTALGKPGSPLKLILIGTLSPMATHAGHWWFDLVYHGTRRSTWVKHFKGNIATWDNWHTIRKANPLVAIDANFRRKLLEERDDARANASTKARFCSYRLNLPSRDESQVLLTVDDWALITAREVPDRDGAPIVALDLSNGRAWSAAVAHWPNGRVECIALAPGIPDVAAQERRDLVPRGAYQALVDNGTLRIADDLRVQPPAMLIDAVRAEWGKPKRIICDRFKLDLLKDCTRGITIEPRIWQWSYASADILALRTFARNGPLAVAVESRPLLETSLTAAEVQNDESGNTRMQKRGTNNTARDDVAAALMLSSGGIDRDSRKPKSGIRSRGLAG